MCVVNGYIHVMGTYMYATEGFVKDDYQSYSNTINYRTISFENREHFSSIITLIMFDTVVFTRRNERHQSTSNETNL